MSKAKISAKDREDAEVLCLLRDDAIRRWGIAEAVVESRQSIDPSEMARNLARLAWFECMPLVRSANLVDAELEAAALIRDGWCPGDPVMRLGR